ncbi:hypothetical protein BZG36_02157 [Bifiguratus adelaidae]|uniref:Actin cytoskeleton-regulatory complex protein PAN1 n=1 Tax=Bifiguratus adelaidae TaxID=1938954 RepID=A0A261Y309_9FUNG|nr:hypothetical protein BZG36_02157 [Bifiguratus adelaidae]
MAGEHTERMDGWHDLREIDPTLSAQEQQVYKGYFKQVDVEEKGVVLGSEAVPLFSQAGLPPATLAEIWQRADTDNKGFLTEKDFNLALKLIACAQQGLPLSSYNTASLPLPTFGDAGNAAIQGRSASATRQNAASDTISPQDRDKFTRLFYQTGAHNGELAGKARNVFLKSGLPLETLSNIWTLADSRAAGSLTLSDFIIAMHYIQESMDHPQQALPATVPPALRSSATESSHQPPQPSALHAMSPLQQSAVLPPLTGQSQYSIPSQMTGTIGGLPNVQAPQMAWDVTPADKAKYDRMFETIASSSQAMTLSGAEAGQFFQKSGLPDDDLARIWDLADIYRRGELTRDEFAIAMLLIQKHMSGQPIPVSLPPSLYPPSERAGLSQGLGAPPQQFNLGASALGGGSAQSQLASAIPAPVPNANKLSMMSLLDDIESMGTQVSPVPKAALASLNLPSLEPPRGNTLDAQKADITERVNQARKRIEEEKAALAEVEAAIAAEQPKIDNLKQDFMQGQTAFDQVQQQKQEIIMQMQGKMGSVDDMRKQIQTMKSEETALRAEIEKLQKQTKQQKSMLDINRRQVSAAEMDRDRLARQVKEAMEAEPLEASKSPVAAITPARPAPEAQMPKADNPFASGASTPFGMAAGTVTPSSTPTTTGNAAGPTSPADPFAAYRSSPSSSSPQGEASTLAKQEVISVSPATLPVTEKAPKSPTASRTSLGSRPSSVSSNKAATPVADIFAAGAAVAAGAGLFGSSGDAESTEHKKVDGHRPPPPPPSRQSRQTTANEPQRANTISFQSSPASATSTRRPAPPPPPSKSSTDRSIRIPAPASPAAPAGPTPDVSDPFAAFSKTFDDAKKRPKGADDFDTAFGGISNENDFVNAFPTLDTLETTKTPKADGVHGFEDTWIPTTSTTDASKPLPSQPSMDTVTGFDDIFAAPTASGTVSASNEAKQPEPSVSAAAGLDDTWTTQPAPASTTKENDGGEHKVSAPATIGFDDAWTALSAPTTTSSTDVAQDQERHSAPSSTEGTWNAKDVAEATAITAGAAGASAIASSEVPEEPNADKVNEVSEAPAAQAADQPVESDLMEAPAHLSTETVSEAVAVDERQEIISEVQNKEEHEEPGSTPTKMSEAAHEATQPQGNQKPVDVEQSTEILGEGAREEDNTPNVDTISPSERDTNSPRTLSHKGSSDGWEHVDMDDSMHQAEKASTQPSNLSLLSFDEESAGHQPEKTDVEGAKDQGEAVSKDVGQSEFPTSAIDVVTPSEVHDDNPPVYQEQSNEEKEHGVTDSLEPLSDGSNTAGEPKQASALTSFADEFDTAFFGDNNATTTKASGPKSFAEAFDVDFDDSFGTFDHSPTQNVPGAFPSAQEANVPGAFPAEAVKDAGKALDTSSTTNTQRAAPIGLGIPETSEAAPSETNPFVPAAPIKSSEELESSKEKDEELDQAFAISSSSVQPTTSQAPPSLPKRLSFKDAFGFDDSFGGSFADQIEEGLVKPKEQTPATSTTSVPIPSSNTSSGPTNPFGISESFFPPSYSPPRSENHAGPAPALPERIAAPATNAPEPAPTVSVEDDEAFARSLAQQESLGPQAPQHNTEADDIPQLKQLMELGFSREQAVDALERYDYDVSLATNFLLDN